MEDNRSTEGHDWLEALAIGGIMLLIIAMAWMTCGCNGHREVGIGASRAWDNGSFKVSGGGSHDFQDNDHSQSDNMFHVEHDAGEVDTFSLWHVWHFGEANVDKLNLLRLENHALRQELQEMSGGDTPGAPQPSPPGPSDDGLNPWWYTLLLALVPAAEVVRRRVKKKGAEE